MKFLSVSPSKYVMVHQNFNQFNKVDNYISKKKCEMVLLSIKTHV